MNQQSHRLGGGEVIGRTRVEHAGSDVWIVSLLGEHDVSNVADLDARLRDVHRHGTRVVLDLSESSFIDSNVVTSVAREASQDDRTPGDGLAVVAPTGSRARRVLDVLQVEHVRVVENRSDAITALGADFVAHHHTSRTAGGSSDD